MQQPHQRDEIADVQAWSRRVDSAVYAGPVLDMLSQLRTDVSIGRLVEENGSLGQVGEETPGLQRADDVGLELQRSGGGAEAASRGDCYSPEGADVRPHDAVNLEHGDQGMIRVRYIWTVHQTF